MTKSYYEVPAVSNSGMSHINPEQGGTPRRYHKNIILREREEEETISLENGKLIHLYVEDPGAFIISDVEKPTGMLAEWVEDTYNLMSNDITISKDSKRLRTVAMNTRGERYKSTKDEDKLWAKFCEGLKYLSHLKSCNEGHVMTSKQKEIVENCIISLRANETSRKLLFESGDTFGDEEHNELSIYWTETIKIDEQEVSLDCKALLDRVKISVSNKTVHIIDLKTTSKPVAKFNNSFEFYRYYRQMGWYLRGIQKYLEEKYPDSFEEFEYTISMVVVETYGLHECFVYNVTNSWITKGIHEAKSLLGRIAFATKHDEWTKPVEEVLGKGFINLINEDDVKRR